MAEPFSMDDFLQDQPQCKELTGERLEIAYQQWLEDIYNEMKADSQLSRSKETDWENV
jgi:hypothetical protein